MQKRCTKGKSCGATCIDPRERCVLELGPLVAPSVTKVRTHLGDIFMRAIEAGKAEKDKEKAPSAPSDLKRQLAALGPPRQMERSPGARTRTAPAVRRDLAGIAESAKKGSLDLMMDDISRIMRGSLPQNIEIVAAGNELGMNARPKTSVKGSATGNTRWARDDAEDFDKSFKIYKRIRGDKDMIDWDETVKNGRKIGEGSFGSVLKVGNMAVKRGEVGADEAAIIKRVGEAGIGPKLHGAEISTKKRDGFGVDLHNGRIAMSMVPGKELGDVKADSKVAGKNAAEIYWKAMADLHRLGIAHNDAHPHNLMVDDKGKGRWVDMGLAQANPRAALAEAMGSFKERKGGDAISVPGSATGQGNWQTLQWNATGAKAASAAYERGGKTWSEYKERFPVTARIWENQEKVVQRLEQRGLDVNEINSIIAHGIRSPLASYDRSDGFSKISDKQAQDLLNILYDGI